jgi:hypothetical protein
MSWLFSQALVAEYLGENSLDGEQSAPSSGSPIQLAYCAPDKTTAFSRLSRFGMTFKPLTADRGEELLTLYRAAFPVRTFPLQEKAQASTENAAECGNTWRGWLAKYDPNTSLWKTAQCSFLEEEPESLQTLPRSGMTRDGLLWELPMLERRTNVTGSGLWPTPTTQDNVQIRGQGKAVGNARGTTLGGAVRLRGNHASAAMNSGATSTECTLLSAIVHPLMSGTPTPIPAHKVAKMWPTPQASDNRPRATANSTARRIQIGKQVSLEAAVKFWPTPAARDFRGANNFDTTQKKLAQGKRAQMGQLPNAMQQRLGQPIGGTLNPTWVEWLMGWPLGWTELKPLEMDKSHCAPQQLGNC